MLSHGAIYLVCAVVLTFESMDDILWCYHSHETDDCYDLNKTFLAVPSHHSVCLECSSQVYKINVSLWMKSNGVTTTMKPLSSTSLLHHSLNCNSQNKL